MAPSLGFDGAAIAVAGDPVKVTVSLEMYEERNKLNKSGWLADFVLPGGKSILDAFYTTLQVQTGYNIKLLRASHGIVDADAGSAYVGNFYTFKQKNPDINKITKN